MVEKRHWWSDRSRGCSFCSDDKRQCVEALGCSVVPWRALTVGSSQTSAVLGISHRWTTEAFRSRQAETVFFLLKIRVRAFANESMTLAEFGHLSDRSWWHPCAWHLSVKQTRTVGADRALPRAAQGPTASPTNQTLHNLEHVSSGIRKVTTSWLIWSSVSSRMWEFQGQAWKVLGKPECSDHTLL